MTYAVFYQVPRIRQLFLVQVHVPLRRRDVRVTQQPAGVLGPLLATDFRSKFMASQVQHQIAR
jgi:hypothetical protein